MRRLRKLASGLGLLVLDAGDHGIVLGPAGESAFAFRPAEFRPSATADDRLLDGLAQLAIAATIFPASRDLEDEATRARLEAELSKAKKDVQAAGAAVQRTGGGGAAKPGGGASKPCACTAGDPLCSCL